VGTVPIVKGVLKDWRITSDTKQGRTTSQGLTALAGKNLPDTVVVQLGTNDWGDIPGFVTAAKAVADKIGPHRRIIWANTYNANRPVATRQLNQAILDLANTHPNISVFDWHGIVKDKNIGVDSLGVHPDTYNELGNQISRTLKSNSTAPSDRGPNTTLTDGSLGQLLFAILMHIGDWQSSDIYIEKLPNDLLDKIAVLYTQLQEAQAPLQKELSALLAQLVGTGSAGDGALGSDPNIPVSGSLSGRVTVKGVPITPEQKRHIEIALSVAHALDAPDLAIRALVVAGIGESSFSNVVNSIGFGGVFQGAVSTTIHPQNWFARWDPTSVPGRSSKLPPGGTRLRLRGDQTGSRFPEYEPWGHRDQGGGIRSGWVLLRGVPRRGAQHHPFIQVRR
jgi:hypothetical protein